MPKYRVNGKTKSVWEYFDHTCDLKHQHKICVLYNFEKGEYEINKEQHLSPEKKKEIDQILIKHCEKVCYYCGKKVERENLVGFVVETGNPLGVRYPVGLKCLQDKEWITQEDDFIALDRYLELVDYNGKEELKDCQDLPGYPKVVKVDKDYIPNLMSGNIKAFDAEMIIKFREQVDLEWERDPGDLEELGEVSPAEKIKAQMRKANCQHEWYNSTDTRQRCSKCYVLRKV